MCSVIAFSPLGPYTSSGVLRPEVHPVKMQMRHEDHLEVSWFERCDATLEKCCLSTPHNTRSDIHQICAIANDDAVAGPERSGSGTGVPVPRSTTFVRVCRSFGARLSRC